MGDRTAVVHRVAELAGRQHGLVTRPQLLAIGLSSRAIARRLAEGWLHQVHRGVYAVGHAVLTPSARDLAAVLAAGEGAVVSHRSAAARWDLLPRPDGPVEVTRPAGGRGRPGIRVHAAGDLQKTDVRLRDRIPVTTPTRTLLDLAATHPDHLERALNEALIHRLTNRHTLLQRAVRRPGAALIQALLADDPAPTRSELERKLLEVIARAGLPRPETNVRVGHWEVDALYREHGVAIEVDGYAYHRTRTAFERDRRKDADLQARGFTVVRLTWRELHVRPEAVAVRLAGVLAQVLF